MSLVTPHIINGSLIEQGIIRPSIISKAITGGVSLPEPFMQMSPATGVTASHVLTRTTTALYVCSSGKH